MNLQLLGVQHSMIAPDSGSDSDSGSLSDSESPAGSGRFRRVSDTGHRGESQRAGAGQPGAAAGCEHLAIIKPRLAAVTRPPAVTGSHECQTRGAS